MTFEKKEPKPLLVNIGILAASGVGVSALVLIVAFSRGCDIWGSSEAPSEAFQKRRPQTASQAPARPAARPATDSLPWLVRENDPEYAREGDSAKPAAPPPAAPAPSPVAANSETAAPADPLAMSAEDEAAVKAAGFQSVLLAARASADNAAKIGAKFGSERGLLFSLWSKFMGYPKLISLVVNNDYVIKGFMSRSDVSQRCDDAGTLTNYLSNTKDPSGISGALSLFNSAVETPGGASARAIFSSKLVSTVLHQCGAINAVTSDPAAVRAIAIANPTLPTMMADPRLLTALAANPAAMGTLNNVQASMSQPAPSP